MSKKSKNKIRRGERIICPACYDLNSNDRIELVVRKVVVKTSNHPILRKHGKLEIDYGMILDQDIKNKLFFLVCSKCGTSEKYDSPEDLIEDIKPMVDYIAAEGAFNANESTEEIINKNKKDPLLPKIVRISKNDTANLH